MDSQQKQQVAQQIQQANNVLVAVSTNPTVDELAASIGLTIALNKMDKHATTVFSGKVPSTIEFLQPEKTIEATTDSLRDFIIALDKSKADKLRYKVENDVVRIFITPYRTSITDKDLDFSQGDFNVDVVIALGVTRKEDLDKAVTAHGRILHDATVVSVTKGNSVSDLGSINWQDQQASSLCEMVAGLTSEVAPEAIDGQMATALLTGIIAETDRFKNDRTTPLALSISSRLMASGANQKLIAEKLEEPPPPPMPHYGDNNKPDGGLDGGLTDAEKSLRDGELAISHEDEQKAEDEIDKIHIDEHGNLGSIPHDDINSDIDEGPLPEDKDEPKQKFGDVQDDKDDQEDKDPYEERPTLPTPVNSNSMMQHEKVITPFSQIDKPPKSDKPFDLNEAMQASNTDNEDSRVDPSQYLLEPVPPVNPPTSGTDTTPLPPPPMPPSSAPPQAQTQTTPSVVPPDPVTSSASSTAQSLSEMEQKVKAAESEHPDVEAKQPEPEVPKPVTTVNEETAPVETPTPAPAPTPAPEPEKKEETPKPGIERDDPPPTVVVSPNAPAPPVPPPMTAPQFFDVNGQNTNPFLNPPK